MEIEREESGDGGRGQGAEKQLGCQIKWECNGERLVLPLQRWGRAERRVHQIFIRASVHSLEAHYGTKAAENILEEQLNKKKYGLFIDHDGNTVE